MQTMTVRMPDGVELKGIPVGTPKDQIMAKYRASKISINDVPTVNNMTVGDDTRPVTERTVGSEFEYGFNNAVGSRVGLDDPEAVRKYAGVFTPIVEGAATIGDGLLGLGQGAAFATGQAVEGKKRGRQLARDLMVMGESGGIVSGVHPSYGSAFAKTPKSLKTDNTLLDNITALENSGVNPSLAVASESAGTRSLAGGVENMPIVGKPLQSSADQALDGVTNKANDLIGEVGKVSSPDDVGGVVKGGLKRYATKDVENYNIKLPARETSVNSKAKALYDKAGINGEIKLDPLNTKQSIGPVVSKYSDEGLADVYKNTKLSKIANSLNDGEVSYNDLKQLRRDIYKLRNRTDLTADVNSRDLDNLYAGITKDLEVIAQSQGKLKEFRRAEKFWSKSQDRINKSLKKYAKDDLGNEKIYAKIERAAKDGPTADIRELRVLRNSLRKDEWGEVAATTFNRLGVKNGEFNINHFITNYNKMSPQARELFTSHKPHLRSSFDDLAKATALLQRYDRARPRGSAPTQNAIGSIMAVTGGAEAVLTASVPLFSLLLGGTARVTASMLSSPKFVKMLARAQRLKAQEAQGVNINVPAQNLTRDFYLLSASNDVSAVDLKSLINTLGPDRAVAQEENEY